MTVTRRLAVIEEKETVDSPVAKKLKKTIFDTQKKILAEVCVFKAARKERDIVEVLDKIVTQQLINGFETVYNSVESINQTFDNLRIDLAKEFDAQGIAISHEPYCKGLQHILDWYRLLFIEAFLHIPLADELSDKHRQPIDKQLDLAGKKELLYKQILYFNNKLSETELQFSKYKFPSLDSKELDLRKMFQALIKEENSTAVWVDESSITLKQERQALELNRVRLTHETQEAIDEFRQQCIEEQETRYKLYKSKLDIDYEPKRGIDDYESKLDIDVYYVKEFQDAYEGEITKYNKVFDKQKKGHIEKVIFIEKTISQLILPKLEFDKSLTSYYSLTYSIPKTAYQRAINKIYNLLKLSSTSLKADSDIFILEREYEGEYSYIKNSLPSVKKKVEMEFARRAKEFLYSVSRRDWRQIAKIRDEADRNFENELKNYIRSVRLSDEMTEILPIRLLELRREQLDNVWRDFFCQLFVNELEWIKSEFNRVKLDRSDAGLVQLNLLKNRLYFKKDEILRNVVSEQNLKNRADRVSLILNDIYNKTLKDPTVLAIEDFIYYREKDSKNINNESKKEYKEERIEVKPVPFQSLIKKRSSPSETKSNILPSSPLFNSSGSSTMSSPEDASHLIVPRKPRRIKADPPNPWYSALTDQPWKRALLCGVLLVAVVCVALTGWGLIAQISIAAMIGFLGGAGGTVGIGLGCFITGSGAYCSANFRWNSRSHNPDDSGSAVSAPSVVSSTIEYTRPPSSPSQRSEGSSYREILASPIGANSPSRSLAVQAPVKEKDQSTSVEVPPPVQSGWLNTIYGVFGQYWGNPEKVPPIPAPLTPTGKQIQGWEEKIAQIESRRPVSS